MMDDGWMICQELINLIIQLPEDFGKEVSADIDVKMDDLMSAISLIRAQVTSNTQRFHTSLTGHLQTYSWE